MAKLIKVVGSTKKVKVARAPATADSKFTGEEPTWDTVKAEKFTEVEYDHYLRQSFRYYNYYYTTKDLKKYLVEWARTYSETHKTFDKATIDKFAKSNDSLLSLTPCALAKTHFQGLPLRTKHTDYLIVAIKQSVSRASTEVEEAVDGEVKVVVPKVTIQDRLNDILQMHILYFEELEDTLHAGKVVDPKAYDYLLGKNVPQAMLSRIASVFDKRHAEIIEAQAGKDEQLNEGYAHFKPADYKRYIAFYTKLIADLTSYGQVKKATKKAAVRKPPGKEKLVVKLKYLKEEKTLKLVSVSPTDIIDAQTLWVYNVKTRKLGKYVAESTAGALSVKGTTIIGYDENKSVQKTLRKPDLQLKEFLSASKVTLRKFLEDIKATDIKLNGRIGLDIILLKVQ